MNREKLAWTVSILLIALLVFQIPGTLAQRDDDYAYIDTLVQIHRQIVNNYVEPVDEGKLHQGAIDGMLEQLDPYSVYVPPTRQEEFDRMLEGSFKGVGIQLNPLPDGRIEVVTPIDGSPAFKAGVMAGDIIEKVNGESIEGLKIPDLIKKIGGKVGSSVTLTVRHATGDAADLTMTREEIVVPTVKGYSRKPDNTWDYYASDKPKIGYVRITQFTPDTYENLHKVLLDLLSDGMRGMILDLRFNPGGRLDEAVAIVNMFIKEGVIVSTKGRSRPERVERATPGATLPDFPLIILVNDHSASASEIVAGSLMDNHRALVVGQRTYGKGSVQELIPLDSKAGELKLTVAYYYLPSGRLVHKKKDATDWGVEPQISIPLDQAAEQKIYKQLAENELFHRPIVKSSTRPTTNTSVTIPTTQPTDPQLQQAVTTMIGLIVLQGEKGGEPAHAVPPATARVAANVTAPAAAPEPAALSPEPASPSSAPAPAATTRATRPAK